MHLRTFIRTAWLLFATITLSASDAESPAIVTVDGIVQDANSGVPAAGVTVVLGGSETKTDAEGRYAFKATSAGRHQLSFSLRGHPEKKLTVELVHGENHLPPTSLPTESVVVVEKIVVAEGKDDVADKFSEKSGLETVTETVSGTDLNKGNAQSSTDLLKNTAGVSVNGGASGSSTVSVRGIDQRMLRITVDGQRQGGSGNPLDSIPAEIVQSLEVTKTFTPDMEADAVGGVINVNTGGIVAKTASIQGRHQLTYNSLESRPGSRNSLTWVRPFGFFSPKPNASFMITGSFEDQYRLRERISDLRQWTAQLSPGPSPFTDELIPTLTLPLIESTVEHRQRTGVVTNVDVRTHDTALYVRANFNREWTKRDRNYDDTNPASGAVQALTPTAGIFSDIEQSRRNQRGESQRDAANLTVGGSTQLEKLILDASLGYARTHEFEPEGYETGFVTDHTYLASYDLSRDAYHPAYTFQDEVTPSDITSGDDPKNYRLDYLQISRSDALDEEITLKANAKISLGKSKASEDYFKFGGKAQQRRRWVDLDRQVFNRGAAVRDLTGLVGDPLVEMTTADYRFGTVPNATAVAALVKTAPDVFLENAAETQINTRSGDYTITETVWALYGMGKIKRGAWTWISGLRVEGTKVNSSANQMEFAGDGTLLGFTPVRGRSNYVEALPGLHVRYDSAPGWLYRASVTRSLSRPAYVDIAPFRTLSFIDHRSRIGSPGLKPYQSTNFDLSLDKYSERYGLLSVAVFFKKIDHFITDAQYEIEIGNLGKFIEFKRVNGEAALATGFEVSWQSPSWPLPAGLGKATVEANYSFNHGEAHHPGRPNETFLLPRQVDHQANVRFRAEHGHLAVDASVRYRTGWWEDLIAAGFDNYIVPAWDAELSLSYKVGKNSRITAGVTNLVNQPIRHYAGVISRMNDYQRSGLDFSAGLQWKL